MNIDSRIVELGRGRFAVVECWRSPENKLVAIKSFDTKSQRPRVREEAILQVVGGVSCYIAQIIKIQTLALNDSPSIYLDAYLGGPLHKHIHQCAGSGLHLSVAKGYICELISALAHLNSLSCIHRDIKSSNCVLDHTGRLKLCDFGSATLLGSSQSTGVSIPRPSTARTDDITNRRYTITGTAVIMAPEMAAATVGYDYSVDYWAAGVMLYELLTCRLPPWERRSYKSLMDEKSIDDEMSWPSEADAIVARLAIDIDSGNSNTVLANEEIHSGLKTGSRPSTSTFHPALTTCENNHENLTSLAETASQSWCLYTVDPNFGAVASARKISSNSDINALLGNFSFTPKKTKDTIEREQACDLVRILLTVCPTRRHSLLKSTAAASPATTHKNCSWNAALRMHPFFEGVDWDQVDKGLSPPADTQFDRRVGCMELLAEFDDKSDELTPAQQALFEGF